MEHELKISPHLFEAVADGRKTFEIRRDDRKPRYAVGDVLLLEEYDMGAYTGRAVSADVTYVLRDTKRPGAARYCLPGYCVMGIKLREGTAK